MAWYEWVFSGAGVTLVVLLLPQISNWWKSQKDRREYNLALDKQKKVIDNILENQRLNDLPDIQYGDGYLVDENNGFLQIEIINLGKLAHVIEIKPSNRNWQYVGTPLPLCLHTNETHRLQFKVPVYSDHIQLPESYQVYMKVADRNQRIYSLAIAVCPEGIYTTEQILIS